LKAPGIPAPLPPASVEKSKTKNKTKEPDDEQESQILAEYRLGLSVSVSNRLSSVLSTSVVLVYHVVRLFIFVVQYIHSISPIPY
jgi:hypothetical protein